MNPPVELQNLLQFHWLWLLLATIFLISAFGLLYYSWRKYTSPKEKKLIVKKPPKKTANEIRKIYLAKLNELENNIRNTDVDNREAYQKLSTIIRMFVYEMTGISVQNCTLEEIRPLRIPRLTRLVEEYYEPEFSSEDLGDALKSLSKTRKEIESWH